MRFDAGRLFRKRLGDFAVLRRLLNLAERQRLIARNRCLIALLVDTGLRVNCEAMKLTWKDVDFEKAQIIVRESKTLGGRRVVPLSDFCKAELLRWRRLTGPEFSVFVFSNFSNPSRRLGSIRGLRG